MGICVKFWLVLQCPLTKYGLVTLPKLQISKIFNFFLILHLILGGPKILLEKFSTSEVMSQKYYGRGGGNYPPPPQYL